MSILLLTVALGVIIGVLVGLFPSLPVYTGPVALYYLAPSASIEVILIFWFVVVSGSQFFGSISTITTGIPGEESSTVYINDLRSVSNSEKNLLLFQTALGSFIAGVVSIAVLFIVMQFMTSKQFLFLASLPVQLLIYNTVMLSFALYSKNKAISIMLIMIGIVMSPQSNYALPSVWFHAQQFFHNYTFFMLLLGLFIIPESVILPSSRPFNDNDKYDATNNAPIPWLVIAKSTVIGIAAGLVPGPSASIASVVAYNCHKSVISKIVAAETANNAAVLVCSIPLLLMSLPINQNTLIIGNILDSRSIFLPEIIYNTSQYLNMSIMHAVLISVLISLIVFYILSINLIWGYQLLVNILHHKMRWILWLAILTLITIDLCAAESAIVEYSFLLMLFSVIGLVLKKYKVSPLPMMFAILFGDKIIWSWMQASRLYF